MVCIGIPVLRPLYTKVIHGYYGSSKDRSYPQRSGQRDGTWELKEGTNQGFGGKGGGIYKQTDIAIQTDNQSDEHILSPDEIAQSRIVTDPRAAGSEWRVHHAGSH